MTEHVLPYDRSVVPQEKSWDCGPASTQVVLNSRGIILSENDIIDGINSLLPRELWVDTAGTDYVGLIERFLDVRIPDARYTSVYLDHYPTPAEKDLHWANVTRSINAGFGVVTNFDSPVGNHPVGIKGSQSPSYGNREVFHYVPAMGYDDNYDGRGGRAVWIADPGFAPHGYWVTFDQFLTLIVPKGYAFADLTAAFPTPATTAPVDPRADVLAQAMGGSMPFERYRQLVPAVSESMAYCRCTTVDRSAMYCAQVGHESVGLKYMAEIWGPTAAQRGYEGRRDLGNTQPGDGYRFRGSGPIQVTGRANFTTLSQWAHEQGMVPTPTYFVDNPDELRGDRYGFVGVDWYWTVARPMSSYADRADIVGATKAVNGGTNGLDDRTARWNRCRAIGAQLLTLVEDWTPVLNELLGID